MRLAGKLDIHCFATRQVRKQRDVSDGKWPAHELPVGELAVARLVHEAEVGTSRLEQANRHAGRAICTCSVGNVYENRINEGVRRAFPSAGMNASGRSLGIHGLFLIASLQMGDNVR